MSDVCSICGGELEKHAVTFAVGDVALFRPCAQCEGDVRGAARSLVNLGAKKLGATLEERSPNFFGAMQKALRIARVVREES